jgi:LuxR family transcriptional regulator, maltose regulon positive regulatory protein
MIPLLTTKLFIPPRRPRGSVVDRSRLIDRLNVSVDRRLTLLSAPAGFGKTTLLTEWIPHSPYCVAWLSLDGDDNDPARFWSYVVAALQMLHSDLGNSALISLEAPRSPPIEAVLTSLLNDVAAFPNRFALVLDDYHVIDDPAIHAALTFLLDHAPPQMQLIISTRSDPPLPLARWRARQQLIELRAADLRFSATEAATFLNQVMGLKLSGEEIKALEAHTEGWIAGLQLAALSMQGRDDVGSFIRSFTGSHAYIIDYLAEEVVQRQTAEVQTFLFKTSILDRMCGSLCDAIADRSDSQQLLEQLGHANLFITPLDDRSEWFRYHHLFADMLQARLRRDHPNIVPELHRRASRWYERQRLTPEAINHSIKAADYEQAAALIEQAAPVWLDAGTINILHGWLDSLPEAVVRGRPHLNLTRALVQVYVGDVAGFEARLRETEQAVRAANTLPVSEKHDLLGEIAALQARAAFNRNELIDIDQLRASLASVTEDNFRVRALLVLAIGYAERLNGNLVEAANFYRQAATLTQRQGDETQTINILGFLAELQEMQGRLHEAASTYQQALQLATSSDGQLRLVAGTACIALGKLLREWNDLELAEHYLRQGLEIGQHSGVKGIEFHSALALSMVLQAQGRSRAADEMIQCAVEFAQQLGLRPMMVRAATVDAQLQLMRGHWLAAAHWAQANSIGVADDLSEALEVEHCTLARLMIAQHQPDDALSLLNRLLAAAQQAGRLRAVIEILALQALTHYACGDSTEALTTLGHALTLAEPEGYIRTFVDEGEPMRLLIANCRVQLEQHDGHLKSYVDKLLAAFPIARSVSRAPQIGNLIEPLNDHELEVLRLTAEGLSNREIADRLSIVVGTVKWYLNHIYTKLDVHNRTQAVARARELDLL